MADEEDRTFQPNQQQATRTRTQGAGVGQKEMDLQRDANRADRLNQYDYDGDDNPQEDGGDPSMEAQTGGNHTRRPDRTEKLDTQGPKTRAHQKAEINRQV